MPLIRKLNLYFLDFLFITCLRPLFIHFIKRDFDQAGSEQTYWMECIPEQFSPPEQIKFVDSNLNGINCYAKDLVENWQVLPNSLKKELFPLVKHLVLYQKFWPKENHEESSFHGVSDHIYEM